MLSRATGQNWARVGRAPRSTLWTAAIVAIGAGCGSGDWRSCSGYGGSGVGIGSSGGGTGDGGSIKPMLVIVDPDRVMHATAGEGVGVFTEYLTGGHWRVWWTCDTAKTSEACPFDVIASVAHGAITNAAGFSLQQGDQLSQANAQSVEAVTVTTANIEGVTFDTTAGATITLDAQVGGLRDGSFLFFVQDGKIDGGYTATLTDPLMLRSLTP